MFLPIPQRAYSHCMKQLTATICLALLTGCAGIPATSSDSTGDGWSHANQLSFDGRTRSYSVYAPAAPESQGLMVVLHGARDTVENVISDTNLEVPAQENGLIVVVPAGIDNGWNDEDPPGGQLADDVGFIDALVTDIKAAHPSLPSDRVFAHGFSNGGGLATRLACESSEIRGVGVVGNYYMSIAATCPRPSGHSIPGWFGAGTDDQLVPVEAVREGMTSYAADLTDCQSIGPLEPIAQTDMPGDVLCKQLAGCDSARLCEYTGRGHEMLPGAFVAAWHFLSGAVQSQSN